MFDAKPTENGRLIGQYTASREQIDELAHGKGLEEDDILLARDKSATIADRETDYQKRRFNRGESSGRNK